MDAGLDLGPHRAEDSGADTGSLVDSEAGPEQDAGRDSGIEDDAGGRGCSAAPTLGQDSLVLAPLCPGLSLDLRPRVLIHGRWYGGEARGACRREQNTLICPAGEMGHLRLRLDQGLVIIGFDARVQAMVEGFALEGSLELGEARAWLSNGFQSWSQSGVIALGPRPDPEALEAALAARGSSEVLREGRELSWWYTYVGGGRVTLLAGVASAERWRSWVQVSREEAEPLGLRLVSGAAGERISLEAGESIEGEPWHIEASEDLQAMLRGYARLLPSRGRSRAAAPELGWNSWYELWDAVDEEAVRANAELAAELLGQYTRPEGSQLRIVVDDGWQRAWGEWEPNEKFPSGLDGLAEELRASGFSMGVWLAPLLVEPGSHLVAEHPDWFVDGAEYNHAKHGPMLVLDPSHPGAAAHIEAFIRRIVSWGYDLLKIDFLFAGTYEVVRHQPITGIEAYRLGLDIIRKAAGEETLLLAVGAPSLPSLPYVDAWRLGGDIAFDLLGPSWAFILNQGRSLGARWQICLATLCDPDPLLLRTLRRREVELGSWVVALAGGGLFLSDDLRSLPEERRGWGLDALRAALATGASPAIPQDIFPSPAPQTLVSPIEDHFRETSMHVLPKVWQTPDQGLVLLNSSDEELVWGSERVPPHTARAVQE